ncbi:YjbF family lipoprotein [Pokkaliibacter sp. CJK22405]|uniref:YjbF family lipoprotein n=1 Tax=Pokkaliibacter sp. CJK22405 TaxID=3384615 RepID=UPI00398496C4
MGLITLSVAGCSSYRDPTTVAAVKTFQDVLVGNEVTIDDPRLFSMPYATLWIGVEGYTSTGGVLGKVNHREMSWYMPDASYVQTNYGRLIRTGNFVGNNTHITLTHDALSDPASLLAGKQGTASGVFDGSLHNLYQLAFSSTLEPEGIEFFKPLKRNLFRVSEHLSIPAVGFSADNTYWLDPVSGKVIASRQYMHPDLPPVWLAEAKPYVAAASDKEGRK